MLTSQAIQMIEALSPEQVKTALATLTRAAVTVDHGVRRDGLPAAGVSVLQHALFAVVVRVIEDSDGDAYVMTSTALRTTEFMRWAETLVPPSAPPPAPEEEQHEPSL